MKGVPMLSMTGPMNGHGAMYAMPASVSGGRWDAMSGMTVAGGREEKRSKGKQAASETLFE